MTEHHDTTTKQLGEEDGRRPDIRPTNVSPTQQIGVGGTAVYAGHLQTLETDARLTGLQRYKTYSDILANVSIVAASVRFFLNIVSKAEWRVVPPEESGARGQELADLVQEMLGDMETPWHRIVRRAAMYRYYGFGIQEWTAKNREDGAIGFLDVEPRPQITIERWDTDRHSKVLGVVQRSPQTQEEIAIPREKVVYLVDDSLSDSPEGLGLFRHLTKVAARLMRYEQLEGFGFELDLRGVPLVRAPLTQLSKMVKAGSISEAQKTALLEPLNDFVSNHIKNPALGMLLDSQPWQTTDEKATPSGPPQFGVELLDGGSYSLEEIATAIRRINLEIARILGTEHLLLGDDSRGSFALSKDKSNNFALIVDSTLKELREAFEKDLLGPLWLMNGWPEELKPTLVTDTTAIRDVEQLTAALRNLATAGVVLDREDPAVHEIFTDVLGLTPPQGALADPDSMLGGGGEPEPAAPRGTEQQDADGDMPDDPEDDLNEGQN